VELKTKVEEVCSGEKSWSRDGGFGSDWNVG
jgi:hypothetical protein